MDLPRTGPARPLCAAALSFAAALVLARYLLPLPVHLAAGMAAFVCGALAVMLRLCSKQKRVFMTAAVVCLAMAAGFVWRFAYDRLFVLPVGAWNGQTLTFTAEVQDFPADASYGPKVTAVVTLPDGRACRALVYLNGSESIRPGDRLRFTGLCTATAPGAPDDKLHYDRARGVFLRVSQKGDMTVTRPERAPVRVWPQFWARGLQDALRRALPAPQAALAQGFLTGGQAALSEGFRVALGDTGTAHTVSVSGLHVAFLVGMIVMIVGNRRRAFWLGLPVLFLFIAVAGFPASAVRAGIMQGCLLLAYVLGREEDSLTALSLALLVITALNPYAVGDIGLQLSFAATLGIVVFGGRFMAFFSGKGGKLREKLPAVWRYISSTTAASLAALVFAQPLVALHFGSMSLVSPAANLLTLWLVSLCFGGGIAVAALTLLWLPLGVSAGAVLAPCLRLYEWAVTALARIPFAALKLSSPYFAFWGLLVYVLLCLYLLWPRQEGEKRRYVPALACAGATLLLAVTLSGYQPEPMRLTVLNVGQGQCVLLTTPTQTAVLDCGGNLSGVARLAADTLKGMGRRRIDLLALTHCHADHAGGVEGLLEQMDVAAIAMPAVDSEGPSLRKDILYLAGRRGIPVTEIDATTDWPLGAASLTLYPPIGLREENEMSMAMLARVNGFSFLLTGDMSDAMERTLLRRERLPDIDVLVAGHHGSGRATSNGLLDGVSPEAAILSVGANSYGHPAQETLARLREHNVAIYRTDERGTVRVTVGG